MSAAWLATVLCNKSRLACPVASLLCYRGAVKSNTGLAYSAEAASAVKAGRVYQACYSTQNRFIGDFLVLFHRHLSNRIMNYKGVIIEESLDNSSILKQVKVIDTKVEEATEERKTPWVKQWTLHSVEIPENDADSVAEKLSKDLDREHSWYADFKNDKYHYIIFRDKVFKVDLNNPVLYKDAKQFGISLDIPEYQVDFAPDDKVWDR